MHTKPPRHPEKSRPNRVGLEWATPPPVTPFSLAGDRVGGGLPPPYFSKIVCPHDAPGRAGRLGRASGRRRERGAVLTRRVRRARAAWIVPSPASRLGGIEGTAQGPLAQYAECAECALTWPIYRD
jgi:hypothetical protein